MENTGRTPTLTDEDNTTIVTVALPVMDMCMSLWAHDLAGMMAYTVAALGDRIGLRILMLTNTYIQKARENLVECALTEGSHYIFFVDSDMRFPKDALIRLLAREKDVVGVNYATRGFPPQFVAIKSREIPEGHEGDDLRANRHPTFPESTGLEKTHAIGGGMLLLKAKVFTDLPRPWFNTQSMDDGTVVGEDVWFCRLLEDAGIDVWIDQDLSKMIGHIGQMVFMPEHAAEIWRLREEEVKDGADNV